MKLLVLAFISGLLCACADHNVKVLKVGAYKQGLVVEAEGETAQEARRSAVAGLFELYAATATLADKKSVLDEKILDHASDFVPREKLVSPKKGVSVARLHALVSTEKLEKALDDAGALKPDGVESRPVLLMRILETGPGAGDHVASEAVRRALSEQGYSAVDLSSATKEAANAEARKLRNGALISGSVESAALDDPRMPGFHPARAKLSLKTVVAPKPENLDEVVAEATGIDSSLSAAGAKAMSSAGEIGAAKLRRVLGRRFQERYEMSALFVGLGDAAKAKKLIVDLRARPSIVAAALDSIVGEDVKVRIFVDNPSADELASTIMRLSGYDFKVRAVEQDYRSVEITAREYPLAF